MVQYTLVGGRSTIWSFDRLDKWKWFSQDTPLISRGVWSILNNRPPTLLFPGSVGCGIPDSVYIFLWVGSPATRSGAASLLLLCLDMYNLHSCFYYDDHNNMLPLLLPLLLLLGPYHACTGYPEVRISGHRSRALDRHLARANAMDED